MNEGDVLLVSLPQSDGIRKDRPALFLKKMPPFQDFLVVWDQHSASASRAGAR